MEQREGGAVHSLKEALEFERKGSEFYIKLGVETEQVLAKNLFFSLAKQEIDHIIRIEEIFGSIQRSSSWPQVFSKETNEIEGAIRRVFERLDRAARDEKLDNVKGYELAIDFERRGYEMYKNLSAKAADDNEKRFFAALAEEESKHLEALDNVYHFLTESDDWLATDESKAWNWMST